MPSDEADRRAHDLVGVLVADEHRLEHALRLVGLVDRQRVGAGSGRRRVSAMRTRSASRLCSASTSWKTSASRRYDSTRVGSPPGAIVVEQPEMAGPDYHRSPDRSQFRCTFEAPGSGPQRTHEASVRDQRARIPRAGEHVTDARAHSTELPARSRRWAATSGRRPRRAFDSLSERAPALARRAASRPSRSRARRRCPRRRTPRSAGTVGLARLGRYLFERLLAGPGGDVLEARRR